MNCPKCKNNLIEIKKDTLLIDICNHCLGIWFDDGEILKFAKQLINKGVIVRRKPKLFQQIPYISVNEIMEYKRVCPKCNISLQKSNYAYNSNIFIDRCENCSGIWTDTNEAKRIAKFLKKDISTIFLLLFICIMKIARESVTFIFFILL